MIGTSNKLKKKTNPEAIKLKKTIIISKTLITGYKTLRHFICVLKIFIKISEKNSNIYNHNGILFFCKSLFIFTKNINKKKYLKKLEIFKKTFKKNPNSNKIIRILSQIKKILSKIIKYILNKIEKTKKKKSNKKRKKGINKNIRNILKKKPLRAEKNKSNK